MFSCSEKNPDALDMPWIDSTMETAYDIVMTMSDSGQVNFRIKSPLLKKYELDNKVIEEFPEGLFIEFFDENHEPSSTVSAYYARRIGEEGIMTLRDSVVFVNTHNDKIESNIIVWDVVNNQISTTKFFKLIRAETKDTIYGIGMNSKIDFTRMEVTKFEGKSLYKKDQ